MSCYKRIQHSIPMQIIIITVLSGILTAGHLMYRERMMFIFSEVRHSAYCPRSDVFHTRLWLYQPEGDSPALQPGIQRHRQRTE